MMLNRDGYVTFINPSAAKMIHVNVAESIGKHMTALVPFKPVAMQSPVYGSGLYRQRSRGGYATRRAALYSDRNPDSR